MKRTSAVLLMMWVSACDDAPAPPAQDLSAVADMGQYDLSGPFLCGTAGVCTAPQRCCVQLGDGGALVGAACANTCATGFPVDCQGPHHCLNGNPCCLFFSQSDAGVSPREITCTTTPSACATDYQSNMQQARLCNSDEDCTSGLQSTMFPECCTSSAGQRLCFNSLYIDFSMGAFTSCP